MLNAMKFMTQAALVSALALLGLTACSSDGENQEGVSEEVSADNEAGEEKSPEAMAEGETPEASSDVLKQDDSEAEEATTKEEPAMMAPVVEEKAPVAAPVAAAPAAPATGRAVFFVKSDTATLRDQPSAGGKETGTLRKGDSIVAEQEGDWVKTSAGKFVAFKDLSRKPVPRARVQRTWGSGGESPAKGGKKSH